MLSQRISGLECARRNWLAIALLALSARCSSPTLDLTGRWEGTADLTVDGESRTAALAWELKSAEAGVEGHIVWDELVRAITSSTFEGPDLQIESHTEAGTIVFHGLYRTEQIEGRFSIRYSADPEPFTGRFRVSRKR